jgi:hypothetical protein
MPEKPEKPVPKDDTADRLEALIAELTQRMGSLEAEMERARELIAEAKRLKDEKGEKGGKRGKPKK